MSKEHFEISARLLTMLGEKLIEDGKVALTELIKNGYDADAKSVSVDFIGFYGEESLSQDDHSKIAIIDNGHGMTKECIIKSYLNIASSIKHSETEVRKSPAGRVYLGSHGIGRFSLLKLGKRINILTKADNDKYYSLIWDFSGYNSEFLDDEQLAIPLSTITVDLNDSSEEEFSKYSPYTTGTIIIIEYLNESWSMEKIRAFASNITTFSPIKLRDNEVAEENSFTVKILRDGKNLTFSNNKELVDINTYELDYLKSLIETEAVYRIEDGVYHEDTGDITFTLVEGPNGAPKIIQLNTRKFINLQTYRDGRYNKFFNGTVDCGDFRFNTYIFNFDKSSFTNFNKLTPEQVAFLKNYNIYLYRDGARVLPYGNAGIDWLGIEKLRAEARAGNYFSQGQLVGQIFITREKNPKFQDKTSREGLIIAGLEFEKLCVVYNLVLEYIKTKYFDKAKEKEKRRIKAEESQKDTVGQEIEKTIQANADNPAIVNSLKYIKKQYNIAKENYHDRLEIVEQLAGAGMSVEVSSHELYSTLVKLGSKIITEQDILDQPNLLFDLENARKVNQELVLLQNIAIQQANNIQKLLVSSKQRIKKIRVNKEVSEIISLYRERLGEKNISVQLHNEQKIIIAETIDAVIYQTFCNLLDNSIYWLDDDAILDREIFIKFDNVNQKIVFSDNGPGVEKEDEPYIFDAFFSGKGVKGRGLGLYISKRLLNKYDFDIRLAKDSEKILPGANFVIEFFSRED